MRYSQRLVHILRMKLILKKESIKFCKLCDNEGTTQLPLWSNHFNNSTVFNNPISILLMTSFHNSKAVSVPCDTGKHQDTSFKMNKFSKKGPINFCKYYVVRESFSSTKCVSNYIVEIKLMLHCRDDQLKKITSPNITHMYL